MRQTKTRAALVEHFGEDIVQRWEHTAPAAERGA